MAKLHENKKEIDKKKFEGASIDFQSRYQLIEIIASN